MSKVHTCFRVRNLNVTKTFRVDEPKADSKICELVYNIKVTFCKKKHLTLIFLVANQRKIGEWFNCYDACFSLNSRISFSKENETGKGKICGCNPQKKVICKSPKTE